MGLSIVACGKQETTAGKESLNDTVESVQTETTDEIADNIDYPDVNPEDVDPKTTTMDANTAMALGKKEGAEIDEKYGSEEAWAGYAISQGADNVLGWCWIYYTDV